MLDARKTFVVGLALIVGLSVDDIPAAYTHLPQWLAPVFGSSLSAATVTAILMNLIMRIGVKSTITTSIEPGPGAQRNALKFIQGGGASWAARRDVIEAAGDALSELVEVLSHHGIARGTMELTAKFDELSLDIKVAYPGRPIKVAAQAPEPEEVIDSEEARIDLGSFLVRQYADRISVKREKDRQVVILQFEH